MCGLQFGQVDSTDHQLRVPWSLKVRGASVGLRMECLETLRSLRLESQLYNGLFTSIFDSIYHSTWNTVLTNRCHKLE